MRRRCGAWVRRLSWLRWASGLRLLLPMWSLPATTLVGAVCAPLLVAGRPLGAAGVAISALVALFVVAAHLLAPFALRVFLEPGPVLAQAVTIVRTVAWSVVLLGWSNVLAGAMRASGAALVPALLSMAAIVGVEWPVAVALDARFGLASVFWACPAAFLAML